MLIVLSTSVCCFAWVLWVDSVAAQPRYKKALLIRQLGWQGHRSGCVRVCVPAHIDMSKCKHQGVYSCVTPGCIGNSFTGKPCSRLFDLQPVIFQAQGGLEYSSRLTKTHTHTVRHTRPEGSQKGERSITQLPSFAHEPSHLTSRRYRFNSSLSVLLNLFRRTPTPSPLPSPLPSVIYGLCSLSQSSKICLCLASLLFHPVFRVYHKPWFTSLNDSFKLTDSVCVFLCVLVCLLALLPCGIMKMCLINSPESSVNV